MIERPYVLLSCAMSVDGYIDDTGSERLLISNDEDFDRVDEVRAGCDAILVGANTIRRDNPRLMIRSADRVREREAHGAAAHPVKVTITSSESLDPSCKFFTTGEGPKLVYCSSSAADKLRAVLGDRATVVEAGDPVDLCVLLADLSTRGIRRLMVEGGTTIHTQFLAAGLADELHLAVGPFFVGDPGAPRFVGGGSVSLEQGSTHGSCRDETARRRRSPAVPPSQPGRRTVMRQVHDAGDDRRWLELAVDLARLCPPSESAFSVGAVIVSHGREIARGYSREADPHDHAEESALSKLDLAPLDLTKATIYSSLEPCSTRRSRPRSCTQLILDARIPRVVFAWREPSVFVDCQGAEALEAAGVLVIEIPDLAQAAREPNAHLFDR